MYFLSIFYVFLLFTGPQHCIMNGQKFSILRVPFIVYGEKTNGDFWFRFSGVVLNHNLVLTATAAVQHYQQLLVAVGVGMVERFHIQRYPATLRANNEFVAILKLDGNQEFHLNRRVQRAMLMMDGIRITPGRLLYAAAYGSLNWGLSKPAELHFRNVFISETKVLRGFEYFHMTSANRSHMTLAFEDMGGPVWDMDTGEVVGLILDRVYVEEEWVSGNDTVDVERNYTRAILIGKQRDWIDRSRAKIEYDLDNPFPPPTDDDEMDF